MDKNESQPRFNSPLASFAAFASFPLFATVASVAGAMLPAMVAADQHVAHPNLRIVWSPLLNSALAGACLGVLLGAFCTAAYWAFHADTTLWESADRSLTAVQTPFFWVGLANGMLIGTLTVATFHGALIWNWRLF